MTALINIEHPLLPFNSAASEWQKYQTEYQQF